MSWLNKILNALRSEPEVWAAYIHGQQSQLIFNNLKSNPRHAGLLSAFIILGKKIINLTSIKYKPRIKKNIDILVFAATVNQANSLNSTVSHLIKSNLNIQIITGSGAARTSGVFSAADVEYIKLTLLDALKVSLLAIGRAPIIWRDLAKKDQKIRRWYFDWFLRCHIYMVYFEKCINKTKPKFILISNDHNAAQRCLLALARVNGIKTGYMQHASVSKIFPALAFDYSFLDGKMAINDYTECEYNKPESMILPDLRYVFLTGQKKPIYRVGATPLNSVGLAINVMDDVQDVMKVVNALSGAGYSLRLRWHPAMGIRKVEEMRQACSNIPSVTLSEPLVEPVGDFLAKLGVLVAANSSIHLEAAVAGVMPIYFEISTVSICDYYGYVKNGLSAEAKNIDSLIHLVRDVLAGHRKLDPLAVQAYSATYNTSWEGREGELTASIIKDLLSGADPSQCWGYSGLMAVEIHETIK